MNDLFQDDEKIKLDSFIESFSKNINDAKNVSLDNLVYLINELRFEIHKISPFNSEPVDFVKWVKNTEVHANDYNPNSVAPPEMELLKLSIQADGYTQPIVSMFDEAKTYEVVDGFHRHKVGKEAQEIQERVKGYLPLVQIKSDRTKKEDRMAATIRHNRARGKHKVEAMSDMVVELKNRNWTNEKIAKELGMEADEVLRLCQITGLANLFSDQEFSKAWEVEGYVSEDDFMEDWENYESDEILKTRTVNTSDEHRVFHTFDKWECYKAGFYATTVKDLTKEQCQQKYKEFFTTPNLFEEILLKVTTEWVNSCEHYLTNNAMNRIAWLGQAAVCYHSGIPSTYRSGWSLLTESEQNIANNIALIALNKYLVSRGIPEVSLNEATGNGRQSIIY